MSIRNLMIGRLAKFDLSNIMYQTAAETTLNRSSPHSARRDDSDDNFSLPALSRPCLLPNVANGLKLAYMQYKNWLQSYLA